MNHLLSQILIYGEALHFILDFIKLLSAIILSVLHSHIAVTLKPLKTTSVISILHHQQLAAGLRTLQLPKTNQTLTHLSSFDSSKPWYGDVWPTIYMCNSDWSPTGLGSGFFFSLFLSFYIYIYIFGSVALQNSAVSFKLEERGDPLMACLLYIRNKIVLFVVTHRYSTYIGWLLNSMKSSPTTCDTVVKNEILSRKIL